MEVNKLTSFVLLIVLVGMIIGVGIIVSDKFGATAFYTRTGLNSTFQAPVNNTLNALSLGNLTGVTKVINHSGTSSPIDPGCYEVNMTPGQFTFRNISESCSSIPGISLIYDAKDYSTATRNAMKNVTTEISNIASNWLGLIVTVGVLSIIVLLVINSFGFGQGGKRQ